ncbi:MAG: hypothetical protein OXG96_15650 [Acidobacteria bacterium]|nr:hypothetical protein [Acidobacteriota bacterium]
MFTDTEETRIPVGTRAQSVPEGVVHRKRPDVIDTETIGKPHFETPGGAFKPRGFDVTLSELRFRSCNLFKFFIDRIVGDLQKQCAGLRRTIAADRDPGKLRYSGPHSRSRGWSVSDGLDTAEQENP